MITTTDRVIDFAKAAFIDQVSALLDDPTWLVADESFDPVEYIENFRLIASDLSLDLDKLVAELGSPFEVERLKRFAPGLTIPAIRPSA